jgi:hypothetical protein
MLEHKKLLKLSVNSKGLWVVEKTNERVKKKMFV